MESQGRQRSFKNSMAFFLLLLLQQIVFAVLQFQCHSAAAAKTTFDPMTHSIGPVTQQNWHGKVMAFRTRQVFCILFYKDNCPASQQLIDEEFNAFAKNMTGMMSILAVNCDENRKLCKDENVTETPAIVFYPLMPQPPVPYKVITTHAAIKHASYSSGNSSNNDEVSNPPRAQLAVNTTAAELEWYHLSQKSQKNHAWDEPYYYAFSQPYLTDTTTQRAKPPLIFRPPSGDHPSAHIMQGLCADSYSYTE